MKKISINLKQVLLLTMIGLAGCLSAQRVEETRQETEEKTERQRPPKGERPSLDEMFTKMDTDNDGKLSTAEVKGPLKDNFAKVDTNGNGFISKEELENTPRPKRRPKPRG